jgi:hypothetical protein
MPGDDPRIGQELGGYRIEALVARGGMGVVYRAVQPALGRRVALKVITPETAEDPEYRRRFEREWRMAAALEHPNILPVHEAGEWDGLLFIAMRYVEGTDLRSLLRSRGRLDLDEVVRILGQVGDALDAAHDEGLVHRDIKPANILIDPRKGRRGSEHVYLADFGVARLATATEVTATGLFIGTLDYAAPEQIQGKPIDGRADVYSLTCVLYECLAGRAPFRRDTDLATLYAHLFDPPPRLSAARPDIAMDAVVERGMAKDPGERFPTAGMLMDLVREHLGPTRTPPGALETVTTGTVVETVLGAPSAASGAAEPTRLVSSAGPGKAGVSRRALALTAVALAVAAGAVGIGLAIGGEEGATVTSSPSAPPPAQAVEAETVSVAGGTIEAPSGWRQVAVAPDVPGLELDEPVTVGPTGSEDTFGVVVGRIDAALPALLPDAFVERVAGQIDGDAIFVELGGVEARRHEDLQPEGFPGRVAVYVVATEERAIAAVCFSTGSRPLSDCEPVVATLSLGDEETAVSPRLPKDYAAAVDAALAELSASLSEAMSRLRRAAKSSGQNEAARRAAAAYAFAREAVAEAPVTPLVRSVHQRLTRGLDRLRADYEALGAAAVNEDRAAWNAARGQIRTHAAGLEEALAQLAALGFATG